MEQPTMTLEPEKANTAPPQPISDYSASTAQAIARRIAERHASGFGGLRPQQSWPESGLTWAMIDRGIARHPANETYHDRFPGAPLLGFVTAASASMLLWGAAVMITLRLV